MGGKGEKGKSVKEAMKAREHTLYKKESVITAIKPII